MRSGVDCERIRPLEAAEPLANLSCVARKAGHRTPNNCFASIRSPTFPFPKTHQRAPRHGTRQALHVVAFHFYGAASRTSPKMWSGALSIQSNIQVHLWRPNHLRCVLGTSSQPRNRSLASPVVFFVSVFGSLSSFACFVHVQSRISCRLSRILWLFTVHCVHRCYALRLHVFPIPVLCVN